LRWHRRQLDGDQEKAARSARLGEIFQVLRELMIFEHSSQPLAGSPG